jgi:hypothetical protein
MNTLAEARSDRTMAGVDNRFGSDRTEIARTREPGAWSEDPGRFSKWRRPSIV